MLEGNCTKSLIEICKKNYSGAAICIVKAMPHLNVQGLRHRKSLGTLAQTLDFMDGENLYVTGCSFSRIPPLLDLHIVA
jgi:hypothetical protein